METDLNTDFSKLVTIARRMDKVGTDSEALLRTIKSWPWEHLENLQLGHALIKGPNGLKEEEAVDYIRDCAGVK